MDELDEALNPQALQSVCELLAPEDRACARLACCALRDACREADAEAGATSKPLPFRPFFRTAALAAFSHASQAGGTLPPSVFKRACLLAAAEGGLGVHWARAKGAPWGAQVDAPEIVEVRFPYHSPFPSGVSGSLRHIVKEVAALHGRLQVLQWAHGQGCKWDKHMPPTRLQWARGGQSCKWDKHTSYKAPVGAWYWWPGLHGGQAHLLQGRQPWAGPLICAQAMTVATCSNPAERLRKQVLTVGLSTESTYAC